jgi:hypothetical protein
MAAVLEPPGNSQRIQPEEKRLGVGFEPVQLYRTIVRLEPAQRGSSGGAIAAPRVTKCGCEHREILQELDCLESRFGDCRLV